MKQNILKKNHTKRPPIKIPSQNLTFKKVTANKLICQTISKLNDQKPQNTWSSQTQNPHEIFGLTLTPFPNIKQKRETNLFRRKTIIKKLFQMTINFTHKQKKIPTQPKLLIFIFFSMFYYFVKIFLCISSWQNFKIQKSVTKQRHKFLLLLTSGIAIENCMAIELFLANLLKITFFSNLNWLFLIWKISIN